MSMKIYNGFLADLDGDGLFQRIDELREVLTPVYEDLYLSTYARLSVAAFEGQQSSPLSSTWITMTRAEHDIRKSGIRNPVFDFGFEMCFLKHPYSNTQALAIAYCEKDEYLNVVRSLDQFEAWPYWNNTDKPDEIHDDDWMYRYDTWTEALGHSAPAARGLTWSLRGYYDPPPDHHSPLFAKHVARVSNSTVTVEQLREAE